MKQICLFVCLLAGVCVPSAQATDYYVDCLRGSNGASGDVNHPWRTPLKAGTFSLSPGFAAGDRILLRRDCSWNSTLTISAPSAGSSSSPIIVDSFSPEGVPGVGQAPHLTGYRPIAGTFWGLPASNNWPSKPLFDDDGSGGDNCPTDHNCVQCPTTGFTYSCLDQPMEVMNFVIFGTIWGNKQSSTSALAHDRDWFFDTSTQILYVYCTCTGGVTPDIYYGVVAPIAISNAKLPINGGSTMLKINNATWVHAQHLQMDWYDTYGVQVLGASDHLVFANMVADSQVPNSTTPVGFYVHPSSPPGDIHIFNTDSHRNYVGYRFDGSATAIELKNCRAFANRTYGVMDDAVTAWSGEYQSWSDYLPQAAEDIFPGDALAVSVPTRSAAFNGILHEVDIQVKDLAQDHSTYKLSFAEDAAQPIGFEFQTSRIQNLSNIVAVPID
ncbi:MAG TPA: hypothetical protein VLK33_15460, partial [Terriglobales bacterium]|nr:hypothetical protein [Terriglobales bacterium]